MGENKDPERRSEHAKSSFERASLAWCPGHCSPRCVCELTPWDLMLQSKFHTTAEGTTARVINSYKTSCPQTLKLIRNRFSPPPGRRVRQRERVGVKETCPKEHEV